MTEHAATGQRLRRVQLQLDFDAHAGGADRPRPIKFGIAAVLRELLPEAAGAHELAELTTPERAQLYRMAGLPVHRRIEIEEHVRAAIRRRYRRPA